MKNMIEYKEARLYCETEAEADIIVEWSEKMEKLFGHPSFNWGFMEAGISGINVHLDIPTMKVGIYKEKERGEAVINKTIPYFIWKKFSYQDWEKEFGWR